MSDSNVDFMDLITHRAAWRTALEIARDNAERRAPDIDDVSYWEHEISVMDRTLGVLDRKAVVNSEISAAANLDRFFDIVSDKLVFLLTGGIHRDAMFTMPVFSNAERVYEVMSNLLFAVQTGGLMKYLEGGHATNEIAATGMSDAQLVREIVYAFREFDDEVADLIDHMAADAVFHSPHTHVYSELKLDELRNKTFARWERNFNDIEDRVFDFVVTCMDGISPTCDLLRAPEAREDFVPNQLTPA